MQGGPGQNHPYPPGRIDKADYGVREGVQVSTTTPPTRTHRYIRVAESEVHERYQVSKPTPPTRTHRENGAAFSRVGVERGKWTN